MAAISSRGRWVQNQHFLIILPLNKTGLHNRLSKNLQYVTQNMACMTVL